jgi:drug/metabolite transporter (DMT)-like permease
LVLGVGVLAVSVSAILIRFAQNEAVPSLVIAAWRLAFAAAILLPMALLRRREELRALTPAQWGAAALSGLMLAAHFATWISSLNHTSIVSSTVLVTTSPLWVALAAPFVLKERVGWWARLGIGLALAGSVVVALNERGGETQSLLGNGLALLGGVTAAAYLLIGRKLRTSLSLLGYITIVYGIAALVLLVVAGLRHPLHGYSGISYALFLLMALFPQLLGHSSFNWALGWLPAAYVTVTIISEPIGASLLAILIFGEWPTALTVAGGVLILAGIVVAGRDQG